MAASRIAGAGVAGVCVQLRSCHALARRRGHRRARSLKSTSGPDPAPAPPHRPAATMFSCLVPRPGSPEPGAKPAPAALSVTAVAATERVAPPAPPPPHASQHARAFARALVENADYRCAH